jgi:hypothetical protein
MADDDAWRLLTRFGKRVPAANRLMKAMDALDSGIEGLEGQVDRLEGAVDARLSQLERRIDRLSQTPNSERGKRSPEIAPDEPDSDQGRVKGCS